MKMLRTILCLLLLLPLMQVAAQDDIGRKLNSTIKDGDAISLSKHFNTRVDITLPSVDDTFSQNHATQVLKDFFTKYPPSSFIINHDGTSNDGSLYLIGTYKSGDNTFRVYILLKKSADRFKIFQLQFEKK
ncbi:MAG: DUF4783 domain-containing protein [Bacteroidota bacterium]|nr:DUF4783 domain-containing protein [Bacteroidota bacterium]